MHSLCLAELPGGFWGAPMDCNQSVVDAGCPAPSWQWGKVLVGLEGLSFPRIDGWVGHSCFPGDAQPCLEVLEDTCLSVGLSCL